MLVLLGLVAVRVVYYLLWRKHWDRRPERRGRVEPAEVVVIRETESHLAVNPPPGGSGDPARPNDVGT